MPNDNAPRDSAATASAPYRVLARKYRPSDFAGLIGQEALVRTLTNAIAQGRLAHAFMLTGVRGVGKTTTARILARAFNCIGPDGKGGPTAPPGGAAGGGGARPRRGGGWGRSRAEPRGPAMWFAARGGGGAVPASTTSAS